MLCRERKVPVGGHQTEVVAYAELHEQSVDRAELHTRAAAAVPDLRGTDVIFALGNDERQRREPLDDLPAGARTVETCSSSCSTNFGVMAVVGSSPEWVTYAPLAPLALLLLTGSYLFVRPYVVKGRLGHVRESET